MSDQQPNTQRNSFYHNVRWGKVAATFHIWDVVKQILFEKLLKWGVSVFQGLTNDGSNPSKDLSPSLPVICLQLSVINFLSINSLIIWFICSLIRFVSTKVCTPGSVCLLNLLWAPGPPSADGMHLGHTARGVHLQHGRRVHTLQHNELIKVNSKAPRHTAAHLHASWSEKEMRGPTLPQSRAGACYDHNSILQSSSWSEADKHPVEQQDPYTC